MTDPTDAEIEAMAEKLWAKYQQVEMPGIMPLPWKALLKLTEASGSDRNVVVFRAMACVALGARHD